MKKLTKQEKEIVQAVARTTVFNDIDVWKVYDILKSFDDTIKVLKHSSLLGITPYDMISIIKEYK
ncbi:MAG TPA: hypothetical protein ENH82_08220 [bacterium]|nr:hypothetical protein [bacterium]